MKKAALPAALMLVAAGIVGGIVAFMGSEVRLASKAPQNTTIWVEAQNLEASWNNFKKSEAFKEFEGSKSYSELNKGWEQLLKLANTDKHLKEMQELGLAINEANLLNFVGQNVALGVVAGDGSAPPATYVMTRIDVIGLAKEIAVDGNWQKVWEKLQNMLGGKDVVKTTYKGYDIATRKFPVPTKSKEWSIHFSMIEDTLVASQSKPVVESIIDVCKGDAKSLDQLPAFDDEVDALDRGKIAYAWADVGLVRNKKRVKAIVDAAAKAIVEETGDKSVLELTKKFTGEELNVLIEDLHPDVSGLAVGLHAPGANPYRAHFAGSRPTEEVFKDTKTNDVRVLAGEDTMFLFESKNLFDLAVRFVNSKTAAKLQQTEAWRWVRKKMEDPSALAVGPGVPVKENPLFEIRTGIAIAQAVLKEVLGESIAIAIGTKEAKELTEAIRPSVYYRPRPVVRIVADVLLGVAASHGEMCKTKRADVGGYPAFQIKPNKSSPTIHIARIGSDFLITTQADIVAASVEKAGKKGTFGSPTLKATMGKIPPGYQMLAYMDYQRLGPLMKGLMKDLGAPKGQNTDETIKLLNTIYGPMAQAYYVSDDFTSWKIQTYQAHAEGVDERFKKLYVNATEAPALWKHMPQGTFGSMTWQLEPSTIYECGLEMIKGLAPEKEFERTLAKIKKELGKDPKELIAHLAGELGVAVTVQDRLLPKGMPKEQAEMVLAVPAVVAYAKLKDGAAFQKDVLPLIQKAIKMANAERAGGKEKQVIAALKTISTAQALFREGDKDGDGKLQYAVRLRELGKADLVDPMLSSGFHLGYKFKLERNPKNAEFTWMCTASPFMGEEGRHFAITHEGIVYHSLKKFELNATCTVPKDSVPVGKPIPGAPVKKKDPNDPNLLRLVESTSGDATVWEVKLPEKEARQFGMFGEGVKPCFAISGSHLLISSSRGALQQALDAAAGPNLTKNPAFQKAIKGQPTDVAAFMHFTVDGVLEQIKKNGKFIALQVASPSAEELKKPKMPEWKEKQDPKEYDALHAKYRKEKREYRKKVAEWRKANADENAATLARILDSVRALGHMVMYYRNTKDGTALESTAEWKLDLSAIKAPEKAK